MKKTIGLLAVLSMTLGASIQAKAADLNPWVDCGIGAMVFKSTPWAAAISNVTWDLGSTAVTSAGLSKNTCEGSRAKVAMLIGTTYANLEEETVQGGGQNVSAMLNVMSCQPSAHQAITRAVRADFVQSLQGAQQVSLSDQAKAEAYYNMVQARVNGQFAAQCQAL